MSKEYLEVKDLQANFINCFNELLTKTDKDILVVNISRKMAQDMVNLYEKYLTINPSEALEKFDYIGNDIKFAYDDDYVSYDYTDDVEYIKQALLKSQEQEKVLKIIFEKNVNIGLIKVVGSVEQYNQTYVYDNMRNVKWCLTQEEFDLLKRYFR